MLRTRGPLERFVVSRRSQGATLVTVRMPWELPWSLEALQSSLLWEVAWACNENEQVIARHGASAIDRAGSWEPSDLDGALGAGARAIIDGFAADLARVRPAPRLTLVVPRRPDGDAHRALEALAAHARLELAYEVPAASDGPAAEGTARRLVGALGLIDGEVRDALLAAARAGDAALAAALGALLADDQPHVHPESCTDDDGSLRPLLRALAGRLPRRDRADCFGLDLAAVAAEVWLAPDACFEQERRDLHDARRRAPSTRFARLAVARHLTRCHRAEPRFAAHLDFVEATLWVERKRHDRAAALIAPHVEEPPDDDVVAGHIEGLAGRAAAFTGAPDRALALYQRNLDRLPRMFGAGTREHGSARAGLEHKLGQLLREHSELPGGRARARELLENSLALHRVLGKPTGVSMCLCELGKLALDEEDHESARIWFEEALDSDRAHNPPGVPVTLHGLAMAHERAGELETALEHIDEVQSLHRAAGRVPAAQRNQVQNTRDRIEQQLGLRGASTLDELLARLAAMDDGDQRVLGTFLRQNAGWLRDAGKATDAEVLLRAGLARSLTGDARGHVVVVLCGLLLERRRLDEVEALLAEVAPAEPTLVAEHALALARLALQRGDLEEVLRRLDAPMVAPTNVTRSRSFMLRGRVHMARGEAVEAGVAFAEARRLAGAGRALTALLEQQVRAALESRDFANAAGFARELDLVTAKRPKDAARARALILIGDVALADGRFEDAVAAFERALQAYGQLGGDADTRRPMLHRRAARACAQAGRLQQGLLHVEEGLRRLDEDAAPTLRGWLHQLAAHLHRLGGDLGRFEAAMIDAAAAAEEADDPRLRRALDLMRAGDLRGDAAVPEFIADELDPDGSAGDLMTRARGLRRDRRLDEAMRVLEPAELLGARGALMARVHELRAVIALDAQSAGLRTAAENAPLLDAVRAGRRDDELPARTLGLLARGAGVAKDYERAVELATLGYQRASATRDFQSLARSAAVLTHAWSERGHADQAIGVLRGLAAFMQEHGRMQAVIDARYSVTRHLLDRRELAAATDELRALVAMAGELSLADRVRVEMTHAEIDRIQGAGARAIERLEAILAAIDESGRSELAAGVHRMLASLLVDAGRPADAVAHRERFEGAPLPAGLRGPTVSKVLGAGGRDADSLAAARAEVARAGAQPTRSRAIALHALASALARVGELDEAETCVREALALHLQLPLIKGTPGCRVTLAKLLKRRNRAVEAVAELTQALADNRAQSNHGGVEICEKLLATMSCGPAPPRQGGDRAKDLVDRAAAHRRQGEYLEADRVMRAALIRARAEGDRRAEATALGHLGISSGRRRRHADAVPQLIDAIAIHRELGSHQLTDCARALGESLLALGRASEGLAPVREALALTRDPDRGTTLAALLARLEQAALRPPA